MSTAERVLAHLQRWPDDCPTARELADILRVDLADVNTALKHLEADGLVRKGGTGHDRSRAWMLAEEN